MTNEIEAYLEYNLISLHGFQHSRDYSNWTRQYFGQIMPYPSYPLATSFSYASEWGGKFLQSIMPLIVEFECSLIREIAAGKIEGAVVEFGVFHGYMLGRLIEECERIQYTPDIFGFDQRRRKAAVLVYFSRYFSYTSP